jgi:hypothetical protein
MSQAFCRLAAVYGGLYVLRRSAAYILRDARTQSCAGIICTRGQRLHAPVVICSSRYAPSEFKHEEGPGIRRCVCVVDGPLVQDQTICLSVLPPGACNNTCALRVLQLDASAQACPKGMYIWHIWAEQAGECDLSHAVNLLRRLAPTVGVRFCAYYTQRGGSGDVEVKQVTPGVWVVPRPSPEVDTGDAVRAAENLFRCVLRVHFACDYDRDLLMSHTTVMHIAV